MKGDFLCPQQALASLFYYEYEIFVGVRCFYKTYEVSVNDNSLYFLSFPLSHVVQG